MPLIPTTSQAGAVVRLPGIAALFGLCCAATDAQGAGMAADPASSWLLDLEYQHAETSTDVIRKGTGYSGTRFEGTDFTGHSNDAGRVELALPANWLRADGQLRLAIAPIRESGTAIAAVPIRFDGAVYRAGAPLSVVYKFNTYRFTYDVPLLTGLRTEGWDFRLGGTLAIRDARVLVSQTGVSRNFYNWGPVPLLYFWASARLDWAWALTAQGDAFPAPGGGGLVDTSLKLVYAVSGRVSLTAGGRYVDGGAASPDFYNHLRQRAAVAGLSVRF